MSEHHETLSPSAWPHIMECAHYQSDPAGSEYTDSGTLTHDLMACILTKRDMPVYNDDSDFSELPTKAKQMMADAEWAADYLLENYGKPTAVEARLAYYLTGSDKAHDELYYGTCDAYIAPTELYATPTLIDLKTGQRRDYRAQMAAYALCLMQAYGCYDCRVVLLYSRDRTVEEYTITRDEAMLTMAQVVNRRRLMHELPQTPNDHCGWCAKRTTCPAINRSFELVKQTAATAIESITDGETIGRYLDAADQAQHIVDAIKKRASVLAKQGIEIPGRALATRSGGYEITDMNGAFTASGFEMDEFQSCLSVSVPKMIEAERKRTSATKQAAEDALLSRLNGYVIQKPSVEYLRKTKQMKEIV